MTASSASRDLAETIELVAMVLKEARRALKPQHVDVLEQVISDAHRQRGYWGGGDPTRKSMICTAIERIMTFGTCPEALLVRMSKLAVLVDADPRGLAARAASLKAWASLGTMAAQDPRVTAWVLESGQRSSETVMALLTGGAIKKHMDLSKVTVAGIPISVAVAIVLEAVGQRDARSAMRWLLDEEGHRSSALEVFLAVADPTDDELLTRRLADDLSPGWNALAAEWRQGRSRHSYSWDDADKRATNAYERVKKLVQRTPALAAAWPLLEALDATINTPFFDHRTLAERAATLSATLDQLLPARQTLVNNVVRIAPVWRLLPGVLQYVLRPLSGNKREFAILAFQLAGAISAVNEEAEGTTACGPIFDPDARWAAMYDPDARLWPKNDAVAVRVYEPVEKARKEFARLAQSDWQRDEDALSERMMQMLWGELRRFSEDQALGQWIREHYRYGSLTVAEPYVRRFESQWAADIAIVVTCQIEQTLEHRWAYLLQAKKAKGSPTPTRWDIDHAQLETLLLTTRAGFYLLYTPNDIEHAPFVVPALAIKSALDATTRAQQQHRDGEAHSIPYATGRRLAKPWSAFFVEDVIGAWSGDARLADQIAAAGIDLARRVFEVSIKMGQAQG
jgi:hypothetical protein